MSGKSYSCENKKVIDEPMECQHVHNDTYITAKTFLRTFFCEKLNGYVSNSDHAEYAIKNFWHQYLPRNVGIELIKLFDVEQNGCGCDLEEELGWELLLLQEKEPTTTGSSSRTIRTKRQREDNSESVTKKGSSV